MDFKSKRKLRPTLDGDFWLIGSNPDLAELNGAKALNALGDAVGETGSGFLHQCVDHHVYQSEDGMWHLWGCIRGTTVGRILYHWESPTLSNSPWTQTGEIIRANPSAGESIRDVNGEEWIQSPYIIKEDGRYWMFYGGHGTGTDKNGQAVEEGSRYTDCQMCLMTSSDGRGWVRHKNEKEQSRVFTGPGMVRDPCLIKIDGLWHLYYVGHHFEGGIEIPAFYVRTSADLISWSEYRIVHFDRNPKFGEGLWNTECVHIVFRQGYYYMFRTENYPLAKTHVFRSENPYNFGIGNSTENYIGTLEVAAPEIIVDEFGQEYITSNHKLSKGTMLCKLKWSE